MPLLALLFPLQIAAAAPTATATVTIDDAVGSAIAHHPDAVAAGAQSDVAHAQARQARAPLLPTLDATGRYGYSWTDLGGSGAVDQGDGGAGGGFSGGRSGDSYNASLSGGLLLWDFGQTVNRWRSAAAASDAAAGDADSVRQAIVLNARVAFFDALETRQLIDVARETLTNQERHLAQTEEFVRIGTHPEIDLARLRTQVAAARAALIRAENDHLTAKSTLNRTMGVKRSLDYEVAPPKLPALEAESHDTAQLYAVAVANRPEYVSARASVRGQEAGVRAARVWFLPSLRLGADASYAGQDFGDPTWGASVGVTMNWNLFDGLASPAATDAARSQLVIQEARLTGVEQQLWLEVEQARIGVASARAELESAEQAVTSARELLRLAEERYTAGVGNSLELSDAQLELANASAQRVRVDRDLAAARAQLLRALGRRDWR
jgi:outer membrane protein